MLQKKSGKTVRLEAWTISAYEIVRGDEIGDGGFSRVYRGLWQGSEVAIKELLPGHYTAKVHPSLIPFECPLIARCPLKGVTKEIKVCMISHVHVSY